MDRGPKVLRTEDPAGRDGHKAKDNDEGALPRASAPDVVCAGLLAVDRRFRQTDGTWPRQPLTLLECPLSQFRPGGIAIVATILSRLGKRVAVAGQVGRDLLGLGLKGYLEQVEGIDTSLLRLVSAPTALSEIRLTEQERCIQFHAGANETYKPDADLLAWVLRSSVKVFCWGYIGLMKAADADGGEALVRSLRSFQGAGVITMTDVHTVPGIARVLERVLPLTNVFFCNREEASLILEGEQKPSAGAILERYPCPSPAARVFGITVPEGVEVAYQCQGATWTGFVPILRKVVATDLTGAGDAFRAGFIASLLGPLEAFASSEFDWRLAAAVGNEVAGAVISGRSVTPAMLERGRYV